MEEALFGGVLRPLADASRSAKCCDVGLSLDHERAWHYITSLSTTDSGYGTRTPKCVVTQKKLYIADSTQRHQLVTIKMILALCHVCRLRLSISTLRIIRWPVALNCIVYLLSLCIGYIIGIIITCTRYIAVVSGQMCVHVCVCMYKLATKVFIGYGLGIYVSL